MPVIGNVTLCLSEEQVLHRRRFRYTSKLRLQVMGILHELLITVSDLLAPAFAYELHLITRVGDDLLCLDDGTVFHGSLLPRLLARARQMAAVVCTIGPRLEAKVDEYFDQNEQLRGLILDHIGTAALDCLTTEVCQFMKREASSQGYKVGGPLSPGVLGWPILEQRHLFELVPAEQIGVRLTSLGMMVPRKSISMVIGMGPDMTTWTQAEVCAGCSLKKTCPYRIQA